MNVKNYHSIPSLLHGEQVRITCESCHHKTWTTLRLAVVDGDHPNWYAICSGCGFANHPVKDGMIHCQVAVSRIE